MRTIVVWLVMCCLAAPLARADNLIVNGTFEMPFTPDWVQSATAPSYTVDRGVGYEPDLDYEAHITQGTGHGWVRLAQTVWIPETDIAFSASVELYSYATSTAWAAAALVIEYLDASQARLGETRIGNWTHYCEWLNEPDQHLISMPASTWTVCAFNIDDELENLPAVDPGRVRYLRVSLFTDIYDC